VANRTAPASAAKKMVKAPSSGTRKPAAQDAIALLKADHRVVDRLFNAFAKAGTTAYRSKRKLVDQMIAELSRHAAIEERILYPAARSEVRASADDVLEYLEEHHVVKWQLQELVGLDPKDERFEAKVTVMAENVRHHVREEEYELFPLLRSRLTRKRLLELGKAWHDAKRTASKRPHPRSSDEPPGNLLPDTVAGVVDKARDLVKSVRPVRDGRD
jgi:hemerythrin-like domain-containing protein